MTTQYRLVLKGTNGHHDIICNIENYILSAAAYKFICLKLQEWGFDDKAIEFFVEQVLVNNDPRFAEVHNVQFDDGRQVLLSAGINHKFYFEPERE